MKQDKLHENADLEYILDQFDSQEAQLQPVPEELGRRFSFDSRSSQEEESKSRSTIIAELKDHRPFLIRSIDYCLQFFSGVKKLQMLEIVGKLDGQRVLQATFETMLRRQNLLEGVSERLSKEMNEGNAKLLVRIKDLLNGQIGKAERMEMVELLSRMEG